MEELKEITGNAAEIIAALATDKAQSLGIATKVAMVPVGYTLQGLEKFRQAPDRKRGRVTVEDTGSIIRYINNHKEDGVSQIFASPDDGVVACVLDYHGVNVAGSPGWKDHVVEYKPGLSDDVKPWIEKMDQPLSQTEFAEHIEANIHTVSKPAGADLLTQVENISIARNVKINRRIRRQDGSIAFSFTDEDAQNGEGRLPPEIQITAPLYRHGGIVTLTLRLQYRTGEGGKLAILYTIDRWEQIKDAAFLDIAMKVEEETKLPMYLGIVR